MRKEGGKFGYVFRRRRTEGELRKYEYNMVYRRCTVSL